MLSRDITIQIGKLGSFDFGEGFYVYVGSALNSLESRLKRHLRDDKKLFWHVDYLLADLNVDLVEIVFAVDNGKWECAIASKLVLKALGLKVLDVLIVNVLHICLNLMILKNLLICVLIHLRNFY